MNAHDKSSIIIETARNVLTLEADCLTALVDRVDRRFEKMVNCIFRARGRLIVSGIGKSGIVGQKIVATLNSTGTRSLFLHPVEAMHGDLGQVGPEDVFLALSYSGETDELSMLLSSIRRMGCPIIAFTGHPVDSTLARASDIVIDVSVAREACPMGLAPTTSTTAMLAMGDALAVVLINKHRFKASDFKKIHPGGHLGQRLAGCIGDIMITGYNLPVVSPKALMTDALDTMEKGGLGVALVADKDRRLTGIITDGDIRRMLVNKTDIAAARVADVMTSAPRTARPAAAVYDVLYLMETHQITVLPIVDDTRTILGVVHLHDILGKGKFRFDPERPEHRTDNQTGRGSASSPKNRISSNDNT